jgi:DNA-binding transcriptional MerR regulator
MLARAAFRTATIHQIARRLGVTPRAIRFYEERGLVEIDRDAQNCRRYDLPAQDRLELIITLRRAGLSLGEVREVLDLESSPEALAAHMAHKLAVMSEQVAERQRTIEHLTNLFAPRRAPLKAVNAS